jgi:type I pantothenate kinase
MNNLITSPYSHFTRQQWQDLRQDTPMHLTEQDLERLHGEIEQVSLVEIQEIYLALSRLLSIYVRAEQSLYHLRGQFLGGPEPKVPFVIGVAGSVAVGKSTTSRVLQALLSCWDDHPRVAVVPTDGFLLPNSVLTQKGLMQRKGFPESYDLEGLLGFLEALKSGQSELQVPVYSHHHYDIVPNQQLIIDDYDVVILEGLNILQTGVLLQRAQPKSFVSDYLDFSIFVDADPLVMEAWYIERFQSFQRSVFQDPNSYFHQFAALNHEETIKMASRYWREINLVNLHDNILPFKHRAQLILHKAKDHSVDWVRLRKL